MSLDDCPDDAPPLYCTIVVRLGDSLTIGREMAASLSGDVCIQHSGMRVMKENRDALGQELLDFHNGKEVNEIIERDDGMINVSLGPAAYFSGYDSWFEHERIAIGFAHGRVLDIGCGAGRHALFLQEKGHEVVAIDNSPGAIEVSRQRGVRDARLLSITNISRRLGVFDTILMMGNNFGLMGNKRRAKWLLRRFRNMVPENGLLIVTSVDIYADVPPEHAAYHEQNIKRGRMPGQVRIRVRYKRHCSSWFDYLLVSPDELNGIITDTGWKIARIVMPEERLYAAIIQKKRP